LDDALGGPEPEPDLPHVFLTSDAPWDPSVIDNEFHDMEFNDCVLANISEAAEHRDAHGIRQPTNQTTLVNYYDALRATRKDDDEDSVELNADMQAQMLYYDSLRNATPSELPLD
jgi:hypothetical protein